MLNFQETFNFQLIIFKIKYHRSLNYIHFIIMKYNLINLTQFILNIQKSWNIY
jgi:hypothetical protein